MIWFSTTKFGCQRRPATSFLFSAKGDPTLGWLFGAEASKVAPGALVRLAVPLGGLAGLDGTARVAALVPERRIQLVHESPWSGLVDCRLDPLVTGGTRLRLRVTISEDEILRLGGALGLLQDDPSESTEDLRLGLLISLSGAAGILGRSTVNCAELAIDEINASGGVVGRRVRLAVADDATDPALGRLAIQKLLRLPNLAAVVGMHSSATFAVTSRLAIQAGMPYIYTATSEVEPRHPLLFGFGETPLDQLHRALPRLAEETGGSRWFFVGNDYSWPRSVASTARRIVEQMGGSVAGEGFLPVGAREFGPMIAAVQASGCDHVISSFVGEDHVRFQRAFVASGLRDSVSIFAPLMDDAVLEHLGELGTGTWNVLGYFQGLDTPENRAFLARYRSRFGDCSAPVSAAGEGVYEAVHRWARACRSAREVDSSSWLGELRATRGAGPRLPSVHAEPERLLLGRAESDGVRVIDELPAFRRAS